MSIRPLPASRATGRLPDRLTVLTCIGCGAMGRRERCAGNCSEHRLELVRAGDYEELQRAGASVARLAAVVGAFAEADGGRPRDTLAALRDDARGALRAVGPEPLRMDWAAPPATVIGWWCARCGNVDLPQPCIGVCVWSPADWVSLGLYEHRLAQVMPVLQAAKALRAFVARAAAVTPHPGQWQRNEDALREQARVALAGCGESTGDPRSSRIAAIGPAGAQAP